MESVATGEVTLALLSVARCRGPKSRVSTSAARCLTVTNNASESLLAAAHPEGMRLSAQTKSSDVAKASRS
eukprot:scaffold1659_cov255-Pinguiococcus_pyrenoidosus.AAC.51